MTVWHTHSRCRFVLLSSAANTHQQMISINSESFRFGLSETRFPCCLQLRAGSVSSFFPAAHYMISSAVVRETLVKTILFLCHQFFAPDHHDADRTGENVEIGMANLSHTAAHLNLLIFSNMGSNRPEQPSGDHELRQDKRVHNGHRGWEISVCVHRHPLRCFANKRQQIQGEFGTCIND